MKDCSDAWSALVAAARAGDPVATQAFELESVVYKGLVSRDDVDRPRAYMYRESISQGVALVLGTLAAQQPDSDLGIMAQAVLDEVVR